jgi:polyisoprenoid-binding protein YceI
MVNTRIFRTAALLLGCTLFLARPASAQTRFLFGPSTVTFFSSAPLEDIEAVNTKARGAVDWDKHSYLVVIPIKDFEFKSGMMKQHFNENYLQSKKYPECVFRGTFTGNVDLSKDGDYPVSAVGDLTIHGVTKKRTIPATIQVRQGAATIASKFPIKIADHNIKVPKMVFKKIAEVVDVTIKATLVRS